MRSYKSFYPTPAIANLIVLTSHPLMVASFAVAIWEPLWWGFHRPVVNLGWPLPSRRAESMDCVMKQSIHKHSLIYRRGGADTGHNIDQSFLWVRESHLESYHFWNYANLHISLALPLSCFKHPHVRHSAYNINSPLQLKRFCQDPTIQDAVHKQTQLDFHHQMGSITHCKN